jgi:hypothetical protein
VQQADVICSPTDTSTPPPIDYTGTLVGPATSVAAGGTAVHCDTFNVQVLVDPPADAASYVSVSWLKHVTCSGPEYVCPAVDGEFRLWTKNCPDVGPCPSKWTVGPVHSLDHPAEQTACMRPSINDPYTTLCGASVGVPVPNPSSVDQLRVQSTASIGGVDQPTMVLVEE